MTTDRPGEDRLSVLAGKAKKSLEQSGNCAQTSFAVLQEEFELNGENMVRALTPFPGLALRGETCGAVIGCMMALGLVFGRDRLDDWSGYFASLPPARQFCERFASEHGSTVCANILENKLGRKFNLADRTDAAEYVAAGGAQACSELVASAVQIAATIILEKA